MALFSALPRVAPLLAIFDPGSSAADVNTAKRFESDVGTVFGACAKTWMHINPKQKRIAPGSAELGGNRSDFFPPKMQRENAGKVAFQSH